MNILWEQGKRFVFRWRCGRLDENALGQVLHARGFGGPTGCMFDRNQRCGFRVITVMQFSPNSRKNQLLKRGVMPFYNFRSLVLTKKKLDK